MQTRRYKKPLTGIEKSRLLRVITMARAAILQAAIDEGEMTPSEYVAKHQRVYDKWDLHHQFPFLDVRDGSYASDLLKKLEKDVMYYVKHGDTPGP